jgi:predicted transcriptional regulator of viral defense system
MKWKDLVENFAEMPLFQSSMLDIFPEDRHVVQVQLSRWVASGKLVRLRRKWYLIQKPWRTVDVPLPFIATQIVQPSYLSLDWALQYHGLIPEGVPNPTCLTTDRTRRIQALDRLFLYHHVRPSLLIGFARIPIDGRPAPVAFAEKALFDKIYFHIQRNRFSPEWLREMRLQNLERFDLERFASYAKQSGKWGLPTAVQATADYIKKER